MADIDDDDLATAHRVFAVLIDAIRRYGEELAEG